MNFKEKINKINEAFVSGKVYLFLKNIYFVLLSAFRETFIYKIFFKPLDDESYEKSLINRFFGFIKSIYIKIGAFINKILKREEKESSPFLEKTASTSFILRAFKMDNYKQSFVFLIFICTLLFTGVLPTMAVVGLCLVTACFTFFDHSFKERVKNGKNLITDFFIFFYLIALFYSRWISNDVQKNKIFLVYFVFVGFYYIIRFLIRSEERLYISLHAFSCSSAFVCLTGIFQLLTGSYKTTTWTDTEVFEEIEGRLVATFENPNVFGEYLILIIPIILAMIFISKSKLWKTLYTLLLLVSGVCMLMTYSRGCWLGIIFAFALFILMIFPKLIYPALILAPFSVFVIPETIIERITSIGNMSDGSTVFRVYIWRATIDMLKKYWLCGIGLGTDCYEHYYSQYAYDAVLAPHSHNTFLHVMCESGIFGLLIFISLLFFLLRQLFVCYKNTKNKSLKIISAAFIAAFLGSLIQGMFDNLFYNYRLYMIFFALVAVSCSIYEIYKGEERENAGNKN